MTTEVLRNMLYAGSLTLGGLGYVVLDEVHYLADRLRGAVWEEVIIQLPESVQVVALSATVSNAEEFGDWLEQVRGGTTVIVDENRPVPLWQHMLAGRRLYDLFARNGAVNPELRRLAQRDLVADRPGGRRPGRGAAAQCASAAVLVAGAGRGGAGHGHRPVRYRSPGRPEVIERLDAEGLLPAITFIFSRAGCDAAVQQCLAAGLRLTTPEESAEIARIVAARHRRAGRRGPGRARLRRLADRAAARDRGAPRRPAADVQGSRGGAVRGRADPGGVRDRDAGARHQHAGQDSRDREAGQVERRASRWPDCGGVHPAHRPGRAARHRRRGARGRALAARAWTRWLSPAWRAPGHTR